MSGGREWVVDLGGLFSASPTGDDDQVLEGKWTLGEVVAATLISITSPLSDTLSP